MRTPLLILALAACHPEASAPEGDWANVDLAEVTRLSDGYAQVQEGRWTFWVPVHGRDVAVGDHLLLGTGPRGPASLPDGEVLRGVVSVDDLAVVSREEAVLALAPPELPADRVPIGEVFAEAPALSGTPITVAGRVVKANPEIFGTNWYHLRDGTGGPGEDDLTVTSPATLEVGDVVQATAPLITDKNLGFGYRYPVILEGAEIRTLDGTLIAAADDTRAPEDGAAVPASVPTVGSAPSLLDTLDPTDAHQAYGLVLGETHAEDLDAWTAARGTRCTTEPALARPTVHTRCDDGLLVVHGERQPLVHHVSRRSTWDDPAEAARDDTDTVADLADRLGPPDRLDRPDGPLDRGRFAYRATWSGHDHLEVEVSLMRMRTEGAATVRHRHVIPGVAEELGDRRLAVHGTRPPDAPNPHVMTRAEDEDDR